MTTKRGIIIAITLFILLAVGLTYLFAVVLPQEREREQLLKTLQ